jgi:hypothetical protein
MYNLQTAACKHMSEPNRPARQLHPRLRIDANNNMSLQLASDFWKEMSAEGTGILTIMLADGLWHDLDMEATEEKIATIEKLLNDRLFYPVDLVVE